MLSEDEIRELLEGRADEHTINEIVVNLGGEFTPGDAAPPVPDLTVRLYLDHVSLEYVLSFRGTDFPHFDDWVANIQNNLTGNAAQYSRSMHVAYLLHTTGIPFVNTGHSLGGGLATAASMVTGHFADTFNSAGLNPDTLYQNDYWKTDPDIPYYPNTEIYIAMQDWLISAYQVWEVRKAGFDFPHSGIPYADARDILTELQTLGSKHFVGFAPLTFEAWGTPIPIEGVLDVTRSEHAALEEMEDAVRDFFNGDYAWSGYHAAWAAILKGNLIETMTESHSFPSIYYGLLHDLYGWNAYDRIARDY